MKFIELKNSIEKLDEKKTSGDSAREVVYGNARSQHIQIAPQKVESLRTVLDIKQNNSNKF